MINNQYTAKSVRKLVDRFFSLQWCRDNLVVPLYEETSLPMNNGIIKIAIANYSYLATLASPIEERLSQAGYTCEFVKKSHNWKQKFLPTKFFGESYEHLDKEFEKIPDIENDKDKYEIILLKDSIKISNVV